jgi:hypothetical protein
MEDACRQFAQASHRQSLEPIPISKCKNEAFHNLCTEDACHSEDQEMSSSQDVLGVQP